MKLRLVVSFATLLLFSLTSFTSPPAGHATFPGANGKIAFTTNRDGNTEIYVMNADGSDQTNLTNNPANDANAAWSADGAKIAFTRNSDHPNCCRDDIYVMNADGSGQTGLTTGPGSHFRPTWSPDGTKIAFDTGRDGEIYVMNADGSGQTNITNDPATDVSPAWSPDGTKIVFSGLRGGVPADIYVMNADGSGVIPLTDDPGGAARPNWSPDGTKIAFDTNRDGPSRIYTMNSDGSGQTRVTQIGSDIEPAWSPDGTKIAFESGFEVFLMNPDGSGRANLSQNPALDAQPDWQPLLVIPVDIDIKPGGDPNSISLGSGGVIPVAVLTTSDFDATTVDPSTVCFGDAEAPAERDCSEKDGRGHLEDADADGDQDMVLHYETPQTGIDPGDTEACLTGETLDGTAMEGCDAVRIVPQHLDTDGDG